MIKMRFRMARRVVARYRLNPFRLVDAMSDDLENLRRVIHLVEEMDAYFEDLDSAP